MSGLRLPGTANDNGGRGKNTRTVFTPDKSGKYNLVASGDGDHTGTYMVSVEEYADGM